MRAWPVVGTAVAGVLALPVGIVALLSPSSAGACAAAPIVDVPAHQFSQDELTDLWVRSGGSTGSTRVSGAGDVPDPIIAGAVGMAESGGDPGVVNHIGAGGLMQIHPPEPNYLDPGTNMHIAVRKFDESKRDHGNGWLPWEAFTGHDGRGDDGPWRAYLASGHGATAPAPACDASGPVEGTPKQVIDTVVLPLARANGVERTAAENDAANARHGPTEGGGRSDHEGPPDVAWAADMGNGVTTAEEDRLADALAERFGIAWHGAGLVEATHDGYRFQLIYRTFEGGDHFDHVHFGVRVGAGTS